MKEKAGIPTGLTAGVFLAGSIVTDMFPENPLKASQALKSTRFVKTFEKYGADVTSVVSKLARGEEVKEVPEAVISAIKKEIGLLPEAPPVFRRIVKEAKNSELVSDFSSRVVRPFDDILAKAGSSVGDIAVVGDGATIDAGKVIDVFITPTRKVDGSIAILDELTAKMKRLFPGTEVKVTIGEVPPNVARMTFDEVFQATKAARREEDPSAAALRATDDLKRPLDDIKDKLDRGEPVKVGNVRLDKLDLDTPQRLEVARAIQEGNGFIEQRRGTRAWEETMAAARELEPVIRPLKAGTSLNAEEMLNLAGTFVANQKKMTLLSDIIRDGKATELQQAEFAEALQKKTTLLLSLSGAKAESGRALNIQKMIAKAIETNDLRLFREAKNRLKDATGKDLEEIAAALSALGDDEVAKYRFIQSLSKPDVADYFSWYWYSSILSGPLTHAKNVVGNVSNSAFSFLSTPFAAAVDALTHGKGRKVFLSEMPAQLVGAWGGMKNGFKKGLEVLKDGHTMDDVANAEFRVPEPIEGAFPNVVSRALEAADTLFQSMNAQRELYGNAHSMVKARGLKGAEFDKAFEELLRQPTKELLDHMKKEAARSTFREETGTIINALAKTRVKIPFKVPFSDKTITVPNPMMFVIPFVKTVANIQKQGIEATPLGLATTATKIGLDARQSSQAYGRSLLGSTLLIPLTMMAAEGNVSGTGPEDKDLREALLATGWQPNSIKLGGKWYSYQTMQPIAFPLSVVANAYEAFQYGDGQVDAAEIAARVGNSLLDQSFLTGLSGLLKAIDEPDRYARSFVENLGASLMPLSSLQSNVAKAMDRTVRVPDGMLERIQANTPGLSERVTSMRDVLGNVVKRPGGFWNQFNPFRVSDEKEAIVQRALIEGGLELSRPTRTAIKGFKMTAEEHGQFLEVSGKIKNTILEKVIEDGMWDKLPVDKQEKLVDSLSSLANGKAREVMTVPVVLRSLGEPPARDDQEAELFYKAFTHKVFRALKTDARRKAFIRNLRKKLGERR